MRNRETPSCLAPGHNLWSHQRKRSEGASLLSSISEFLVSGVWKQLTAGGRDM
jgi:hypothetical protein